jgi:hypothetical protein
MATETNPAPTNFKGVMVSSTFTDLKQHRAALIQCIDGQEFKSVVMENDSARPVADVLDSSLQMVHKASAYIGVVSHKYGQIPECSERNPDRHSLTELEFNEARRLKRPVLIFIMGDDHPITVSDIEGNAAKKKKLKAFRENAKRLKPDSSVHRVYAIFETLDEFKEKASQSIAELRRHLDEQDALVAAASPNAAPPNVDPNKPVPIPAPPAFYAEPPYIGSHQFVGRKAQLEILNDWAAPADSHPVLLFEAIGGTGKSMLTWEWTTRQATAVREDWAGRFWYSFYERGALMSDFCGHALAYITGQPFDDFRKMKTHELAELLLHHLTARPWLIVLDGLERVLVAYHRIDAAQLADEEAGTSDEIADRDPCAAIRPEDDELLRALAGAAPSRALLTSRLPPRVLLNSASQPIPGVLRERLPGLRPPDAEALFCGCGVSGDSKAIQTYLQEHCDCHPLVTGVLAGLVTGYLPDRGNFDTWAADPNGGGQLNLADLDLIQKRNHILKAAMEALDEKSRQLLSTLALLSEAADYPALCALNPHNPPNMTKLQETVANLERRGLLQYDPHTKRHDLHPVVCGLAAGGLQHEEKERYGQRVVDHFSQQSHSPYEEAETLDDLRDGLHVVRTLLQMGRHQQACDGYRGDLAGALHFNLEAHAETLSLLRPFFPQGWATLPSGLNERHGGYLATAAGIALNHTGEFKRAFAVNSAALLAGLRNEDWRGLRVLLFNISTGLATENRLAKQECCLLLALDLAAQLKDEADIFRIRLDRFAQLVQFGQWTKAEALWQQLDPMGRDWRRGVYRPGDAEYYYAQYSFCKRDLTKEHLDHAEQLAKTGNDRATIRGLHNLRGRWRQEQGRYELAAESLHEAVRMAREVGQVDAGAEARFALAKIHLDQLTDPRQEAERLANAKNPAHIPLAELWLVIGDCEQAKKHALAAYKWAWADGEPYVHRYELNQSHALLEKLGVEIPKLPPYDPDKDEKLPWEDEVVAAIDKLRAENEAKQAAEESQEE